MAEENRVVLHGTWASPYVKRVEHALKVKGIPFDDVEEDLLNKSALLLEYNPAYKKVLVLIHNGKTIVESLVILEYVDEKGKNEPCLLLDEPYERAQARFWPLGRLYATVQLLGTTAKLFNSEGEDALDNARQETYEKLDVLEEGIKNFFSRNPRTNYRTENMNILDIMIITTLSAFRAQEEVFGFNIIDPEKHPLIFKGVTALMELPVVKEITLPHDKLVSMLQQLRLNDIKLQTTSATAVIYMCNGCVLPFVAFLDTCITTLEWNCAIVTKGCVMCAIDSVISVI